MMNNEIHSKHVEQTKNCGIKIDYKNCASCWSLTHCNMMHGTHNIKLNTLYINIFPKIKDCEGGSFYMQYNLIFGQIQYCSKLP